MSALATTGLAALILSGCTPGSTNPTDPSAPDGTASTAPAPVVSVVNDAVADTDSDAAQHQDTAPDQDTAAADAAPSAGADSADSADAAESTSPANGTGASDSITVDAGEKLALAVDGGEFVEVRLIDADHDSVPVDTGTFPTGAGTDSDSTDAPGDANSADGDSTNPDDANADSSGTTDEAVAGGTTKPTHGLVDTEGGNEETSGDDAGASGDAETGSSADNATGTSGADGSATSGADDSGEADGGGSAESTGTEWESSVDLVTGATYEWEATTVSPDGAEHTATGTVSTPATTAQEELTAKTAIADDQTVGIGAPIVVMFNSTIPEDARAAIEARLSVDVTDEDGEPVDVEGSWGWLYDTDGISRVHYRPKEFWPAHVNVEVNMPLEGVEYSPRWYGKEDVELSFEVGRDQRVVADASTHRMTIERDGEEIADWPTSLGSAKAPSYNGTHVVMAKHEFYTMTSEQWNYETDVNWAVRIHNNGEFVHAAPWSVGVQGSANVSHGCINLSTDRAKEYFDMALHGDPVEITGSSVDLTTEHSDISDWVYSWDDWQELSALS
ncbi:Ig-like domain-containing protein [Brevibacterium yomogidense]|uniref:Ig-like domain-containing protein n=1 Tax=Brevibacterium yomogidense TaxID=946573 RepID=UPI0018DFFBD4|nr:Ig-like domain-containing protein [Brevibacterium yomogidense]